MNAGDIILGIDPGTRLLGAGLIRVGGAGKAEFVDCGVLDLRKITDPYAKLARISEYVRGLCIKYSPRYLAVESPFLGKNAQVIFKLGRAQGVVLAVAEEYGLQITEYAPRKAKIAICGNGAASKEQVSLMVQRTLGIKIENQHLDSTDALAIAICHYYQMSSPVQAGVKSGSWKQFLADHPDRVK